MLLLTSTSDLVQVVSGGTQAIDVHASWVDYNGTSVTPGRTNTAISTAATTTIVSSPAASTQRNVKAITIRNKDASASDAITVKHTDGTTAVELVKYTLLAGETLMFIEDAGWSVLANGSIKTIVPAYPLLNISLFSDVVAQTPVLGDIIAANSTPNWTKVSGSISATDVVLAQVGTGSVSALPAWRTTTGTTGGAVVLANGASITPLNLGSVRYADQYPGADCGAKINAADAALTTKGGTILVNKNCGTTISTAVILHNNLQFIEMGTWNVSSTITFASGGITIVGLGFYDVNTNAVGTKLHWTGSAGVDMVVAKGTVGNRLDRLGMSNMILDGAGICRYTFNIQKADEFEFHNIRIHAGATAGFYAADATGGKFFNVSIANTPAYALILDWGTGGFDWIGGEIAPQQGMTGECIHIQGSTNGINIEGVEIDNGNTPFVGFVLITGYDTNSSFADAPTGHAGAPSSVTFYQCRWIYTGGVVSSQGADILVTGTATNPSNKIRFTDNLCAGLSVGAVSYKFDFNQDSYLDGVLSSGHTTGSAATLQTTNNCSRPSMWNVISSDTNRTAAGSGNILDVRCIPAGVLDIAGISLVVPRGAGANPTANGNIAFDTTANLFVGGVNGATQKFLMHNLVNTLGTSGTIDASAASGTVGFKTPVATGAAPTANGAVAYDSTANNYRGGVNGVKDTFAMLELAQAWTADQTFNTKADKLGIANIVADSGAINTTDTIIVKTPALAASRLVAGTHIRITLTGTCTSTVANASTFTLRWGTNGTTGDGTVAALVTNVAAASGTNNGFRTVIDLTVRTAGASATSDAFMETVSDGNIGISATPSEKFVAGTAFNTTTASAILSLSYKSAATTTTSTFKNAYIEIVQS